MPIARGVKKTVIIGRESTWGTQDTGTGKIIRRAQSVFNEQKGSFQTDEILVSMQLRDVRHGAYQVPGMIAGPLAPAAYAPLFETMVRQNFSAGPSYSNSGIGANSGTKKLTRGAGSWITDGFRVGMIVKQTNWSATSGDATANNNVHARIVALTATDMTLDQLATTKSSGTDTPTVAAVGKATWIPATGHTNPSFSVEHWFSDLTQSEVFVGCRCNQIAVNIPSTGVATLSAQLLGQKMMPYTSQQFVSPTTISSYDSVTGVAGFLRVNGTDYAIVTSAQFAITSTVSAQPVIGSQYVPDIFQGRITAAGSFTAYFDGVTLRDLFRAETAVSLNLWLRNGTGDTADFIAFHFPRIKLMSSDANDSDMAIFRQFSFIATESTADVTDAGEQPTTIMIQDNRA